MFDIHLNINRFMYTFKFKYNDLYKFAVTFFYDHQTFKCFIFYLHPVGFENSQERKLKCLALLKTIIVLKLRLS